jgi:CHAD domain-containing protein
MAFEFRPDRPVGENLTRLGRKRLDKAVAALTQTAPSELPGAVHGARKDLKKMRALLRMARPGLDRREFQQENVSLRDAGRALSAVRDSQVLGAAFEKLLAMGGGERLPSVAATEAICRRLAEEARAVEEKARLERVAPETAAALEDVRARVENWPINDEGGRAGWPLLSRALKATYRQGRRAMRRVLPPVIAQEEDFHEWRKQVKHLAYQLRLLRPLWRRMFKGLIKELDALAEALGDEHDRAILRVKILEQPEPWANPEDLGAVCTLIDSHRAALQQQALELGRRLYVEKPSDFKRRLKGYWRVWKGKDEG